MIAAAGQASGGAEAYIVAGIAVAGTLLGALIAQVAAAVRAKRQDDRHLDNLRMQLDHASMEANRQERRSAYAAFYDCQRRWADLLIEAARLFGSVGPRATNQAGQDLRVDDDAVQRLRARLAALNEEWSVELSRVQLLGSDKVSDLAFLHFSNYHWRKERAFRGENPFQGTPPGGELFPVTLLEAMQQDIGIVDGLRVHPVTGARILTDHRPRGVPESPEFTVRTTSPESGREPVDPGNPRGALT